MAQAPRLGGGQQGEAFANGTDGGIVGGGRRGQAVRACTLVAGEVGVAEEPDDGRAGHPVPEDGGVGTRVAAAAR